MSEPTGEHSLDELAKGLATGTLSRGKALRLVGGALLGAALASVPGVAWANDRCSQGQTRCGDRCVNLKTNERHCGSCSNRCGSKQTCCQGRCVNLQRSERHCGSCSNRCAADEECVKGECQGQGVCPPEGTPLTEGDCHCGYNCPADSAPFRCGNDPSCLCAQTTEGTGFCADFRGECGALQTCSSSNDCPSGSKCVVNTCCGFPVCDPPCSTSTSAAPASSAQIQTLPD
jgi:hypothetical protein